MTVREWLRVVRSMRVLGTHRGWNWWQIPWPRLWWEWVDDGELIVSLDVGNGSSDPILSVGATLRVEMPERRPDLRVVEGEAS